MDQQTAPATLASPDAPAHAPVSAVVIYVVAFITGAIVMSFEMLGSRYLNPYFGSGIYTWAALISTVLAALTVGYFLGGWLADRTASPTVLGMTVLAASLYLLVLPGFPILSSTTSSPISTTCGPEAWSRRSPSCSCRSRCLAFFHPSRSG